MHDPVHGFKQFGREQRPVHDGSDRRPGAPARGVRSVRRARAIRRAGKPGDYSRAGLITLSSPSPNGTPAANSASTQVWFLRQNGVLDANGQPETNQAVTTVTWHDKTAPAPTWLEPQDGAALELLGQGATPQVNEAVSIDDSAGGVVSAGVGAGDVTCSVDWNAPVSLVQETGTGLWSASCRSPRREIISLR